METVARATTTFLEETPATTPNYTMQSVQFVYNQYNVTLDYIDLLRAKVIEDEQKDNAIRMDFDSWVAFPSTIAATQATQRIVISRDIAGLRKLMFAMVPQAAGTGASTGAYNDSDAINTFVSGGLNTPYLGRWDHRW